MTPENSNPIPIQDQEDSITDKNASQDTSKDVEPQDQKTTTEGFNEKRRLASRFEDFCYRMGDRMFSGNILNREELDVISPEWTEIIDEEPKDNKGREDGNSGDNLNRSKGGLGWEMGPMQRIHPAVLDFSKAKYEDDYYFRKMLEHPAFREKINGSGIVVDIGNGGNMALRIDAQFLQRNGFKGKVIGVDPFRNFDEVDTSNGLTTEAIKRDGLSYLLDQPDGSENILCSNLEYEIIDNRDYARALVEEILRVVPEDGLFICINSSALCPIAKSIFPYSYEIKDDANTYLFTKKPITEAAGEAI